MKVCKMVQEYALQSGYAQQISKYLANALGVDASEIRAVKIEKAGVWEIIKFVHNWQQVARATRATWREPVPWVPWVTFWSPASKAEKSYAPFSMSSIGDFQITGAHFEYHVDKHPEFAGLLEDLMVDHRIPGHKIHLPQEPEIRQMRNGSLIGRMHYYFGDSQERLCIPVEPKDVKYVPEAEHQLEQEHYCIHGKDAPVNPFEPSPKDSEKLSVVEIVFGVSRESTNGKRHLEETLEGLPVPADGLSLSTVHNGNYSHIELSTPYRPFIEIRLDEPLSEEPLSEENWTNQIALARRLEQMFKTK